ncbi:uncharacterized protein LOC121347427 [Onychostruthus taczanowskii]|uniref:uncharacterized protein LOC121347427 n=1 Tax=Onychostruthus taczanowskii TaxID=356909 RepID=UPI001B80E3A5|nr:uncharacterized protein LOC121347427 [Onychostruthus taczanowskii]
MEGSFTPHDSGSNKMFKKAEFPQAIRGAAALLSAPPAGLGVTGPRQLVSKGICSYLQRHEKQSRLGLLAPEVKAQPCRGRTGGMRSALGILGRNTPCFPHQGEFLREPGCLWQSCGSGLLSCPSPAAPARAGGSAGGAAPPSPRGLCPAERGQRGVQPAELPGEPHISFPSRSVRGWGERTALSRSPGTPRELRHGARSSLTPSGLCLSPLGVAKARCGVKPGGFSRV